MRPGLTLPLPAPKRCSISRRLLSGDIVVRLRRGPFALRLVMSQGDAERMGTSLLAAVEEARRERG